MAKIKPLPLNIQASLLFFKLDITAALGYPFGCDTK
jgi:hypothetical protein